MTRKLILIVLLVLSVPIVTFYVGFRLQHSEINFNLRELNSFLNDFEEQYHYVKDTDVVKYYGEIIIKVYFVSNADLYFDESIYEDIHTFFRQTEIQRKMIEKENARQVYITVEFIDTVGTESHYFSSSIKQILRTGKSKGRYNYTELSEPTYYVPQKKKP